METILMGFQVAELSETTAFLATNHTTTITRCTTMTVARRGRGRGRGTRRREIPTPVKPTNKGFQPL